MAMGSAAKAPVRGKAEAQRVFLRRATRALERVAERLDEGEIVRALGSSSDADFLVAALTAPGALAPAREPAAADPLAEARLRGAGQRDRLFARVEMLTVEQVARLLGLTRQGVDLRRRKGRLIGLERGRRGYLYPAWQFVDGQVVPGFEEVLAALASSGPWLACRFFMQREPRLGGRRPIDALRAGRLEAVKAAALAFGEEGAA
jgi:hypothetical protein